MDLKTPPSIGALLVPSGEIATSYAVRTPPGGTSPSQTLAYATVRLEYDGGVPFYLLTEVFTRPDARGHKYASAALGYVCADLHDKDVWLLVGASEGSGLDNAALEAWYARRGFVRVEGEPDICIMVRPASV